MSKKFDHKNKFKGKCSLEVVNSLITLHMSMES